MTLQADIAIECESWSKLEDLDQLVSAALQATTQEAKVLLLDGAEVSFLFCDDARICEINRAWRGIDKATNVLSFPTVSTAQLNSAPLLGDIAIAFETVLRESQDERKSLRNHTSHMIVHGMLHLLGYDHENDEDAENMENIERRALAVLGIPDPYADSLPVKGNERS